MVIKILQEFIVITIIIYSVNMIYFYFKDKSKKYKNALTSEMFFLVKFYGIDINVVGKKKVEQDISILNSIILTVDLLIYLHVKSIVLAICIIFVLTFILIILFYSILGKIYSRRY